MAAPPPEPRRFLPASPLSSHSFARAVLFLSFPIAAVLTGAPVMANPGCPSSTMVCDYPIASTDFAGSCSGYGNSSEYNLSLGSFATAVDFFLSNAGPRVDAYDVYRIVGLPAGPAIPFDAHLTVHATAAIQSCLSSSDVLASVSARISEPSTGSSASAGAAVGCTVYPTYACCGTSTGTDVTLTLHLLHAPGQDFTLEYLLTTAKKEIIFGSASLSAQLSFTGLPAGAAVTSCQGFSSAGPTAERRGSWGALKIRYR